MSAPTKEQLIKEKIRSETILCAKDPIYFIKKYVKIEHPGQGSIPFNLFPFQEKVLNDFRNHNKNIVLKARQMGISTVTAAYSLWLMVFKQNKNIICLATKQETAKEIVTRCKYAYSNLPSWLKPEAIKNNELSLHLKTGGRIAAETAAVDAARGKALSLLILDEVAAMRDAEEMWLAAQSAIMHGGGNCIMISCVTKDTYIHSKERGIIQIQDFINKNVSGGYIIPKYSILGKNKFRSGNLFFNNGLVDTKIIKTKFSELECSNNHKLWAFKSSENTFRWVESKDLTLDDYISIQYNTNYWVNNDSIDDFIPSTKRIKYPFSFSKLTKELCYFIGLFISEGWYSDHTITITCGDNISKILNDLNLHFYNVDGLHYQITNKNLCEFLNYLGFDKTDKANRKHIPQKLMMISEENMSYLLKGIFDGDGCSKKSKISLVSTSEKLINQVRFLLNNFGILSSKYITKKELKNSYKCTKIKHNYDTYSLEIYGKFVKTFYNKIGFLFNRKQINFENLKNCNFDRSTSNDVIPNSLEIIKKIQLLTNKKIHELNFETGLKLNGILNSKKIYKTNHISRENVIILYNKYRNLFSEEDRIMYDKIICENLYWVKIKNISESKNETFDFSLPHNENDFWCHSIIYNGILGHQTPKGTGNFYHKTWVSAESGENGFNPIRLHWQLHPEYNQEWRDEQTKLLGDKGAKQECDGVFTGTGDTVIDSTLVTYYMDNIKKEPISKSYIGDALWTWKYPDYSKSYMVVADVARGDGADFSTAHILDLENNEQVAEFKGKMPPKDFGNFLVGISSQYNKALLVIENNSFGHTTIQECIDIGYSNLFYTSNNLEFIEVEKQTSNKLNKESRKSVPGFTTTSKNRTIMISKLDMYMRDKENGVIINSIRTLEELNTFIWNGGRPEAMKGYNDDLVMALCIGLWVRDTALRLKGEQISLQKTMLNYMGKVNTVNIETKKTDFSSEDKTTKGSMIYSTSGLSRKSNPYILELGGKNEDLRWLL